MLVSIRPARPEDAAPIEEVENAADALLVEFLQPETWDAAPSGASRLADSGFVLVADADGVVAGFAHVLEIGGFAHLEQVSVDPAHARRGYGRALVEAAKAEARARGHERLTLRTFADVPWNAPFYATCGFAESHTESDFHRALLAHEEKLGLTRLSRRVEMTAELVLGSEYDPVAQTYVAAGPDERAILDAFGLTADALLGSGGEARVFGLDAERVLRIQAAGSSEPDHRLARLLEGWTGIDLGFGLPRVLQQARWEQQNYSIEARLPGVPMAHWLASITDPTVRRGGLLSLLDAAERLRELPAPPSGFGRVLADEQRFGSLVELLAAQIEIGVQHSQGALAAVVPDLDRRIERLLRRLDARTVAPAFCHADLGPSNVLVDGGGRVTAVLDVSVHALAADPVLDQVGAVALLELTPYAGHLGDATWLQRQLADRLGPEAWLIDAYRRFYGLYYAMDPVLVPWCAAQLLAPET